MHLFVQGKCPAGMAELLSLLIYNGLYSKITAKNMYNTLKFILRLYIVRYITAPKRKILLFRKKVVFLVSFLSSSHAIFPAPGDLPRSFFLPYYSLISD